MFNVLNPLLESIADVLRKWGKSLDHELTILDARESAIVAASERIGDVNRELHRIGNILEWDYKLRRASALLGCPNNKCMLPGTADGVVKPYRQVFYADAKCPNCEQPSPFPAELEQK